MGSPVIWSNGGAKFLTDTIVDINGDPVGGGSALEVLDESVQKTAAATSLDFVGAGVTVTNTAGACTVTIPGGGSKEINAAIEVPLAKSYVLSRYATAAFTIDTIYYKLENGTCDISVKIDGVDVTGMAALSVTTTEGNANASGANTVSVGNTVTLVVASPVSTQDLTITIKGTLS